MPLFRFYVRYDGEGWSDDEVGAEFPGVDEARGAAIELLSEITKENLREHDALAVRVRDGQP